MIEQTIDDILADGKLISTIIDYIYKENNNKQKQNTCPPIEIGMTKAY